MVRPGLVMACRLATWPTIRFSSLVKATTEGVNLPTFRVRIISGSPPSRTAMVEFVVPRSMPTIFDIVIPPNIILVVLAQVKLTVPVNKAANLIHCR